MAKNERKTSENKLKTNERYLAKLDRVVIRIRKDGGDGFTKTQLERAAEVCGTSVNAWIVDAIRDKI